MSETKPNQSATKLTSVECGAIILGPRMGRNVVLWRKNCRRKTTHESGRCADHRGPLGTQYGPGARR